MKFSAKIQRLINEVNADPQLKARFESEWGAGSIEDYLHDYGNKPEIVESLRMDLGLRSDSAALRDGKQKRAPERRAEET